MTRSPSTAAASPSVIVKVLVASDHLHATCFSGLAGVTFDSRWELSEITRIGSQLRDLPLQQEAGCCWRASGRIASAALPMRGLSASISMHCFILSVSFSACAKPNFPIVLPDLRQDHRGGFHLDESGACGFQVRPFSSAGRPEFETSQGRT